MENVRVLLVSFAVAVVVNLANATVVSRLPPLVLVLVATADAAMLTACWELLSAVRRRIGERIMFLM